MRHTKSRVWQFQKRIHHFKSLYKLQTCLILMINSEQLCLKEQMGHLFHHEFFHQNTYDLLLLRIRQMDFIQTIALIKTMIQFQFLALKQQRYRLITKWHLQSSFLSSRIVIRFAVRILLVIVILAYLNFRVHAILHALRVITYHIAILQLF